PKHHSVDRSLVSGNRVGFLPRERIPDFHFTEVPLVEVPAGRGEARAVGAEGDAVDVAGMPGEGESFLAGGGVPDLDGPVATRRGDARAVGTESHTVDGAGMPPDHDG